jgi:ABC-type branched-subunit amino acid transport system substrate-binding protein
LLVPTSSQNAAEIAGSLEQAARMAVSDLEPVKIDLRVYDTAGRSDIAAQQAQTAVDQGAKIIIGPLFAEAANAAGLAVADEGVNVLSFSNSSAIAGGNVFVLGKTFDNTAERVVGYLARSGKQRAVIVYPDNLEGEAGRSALEKAAQYSSLKIAHSQAFEFSQEGVVAAIPLIRAAVEIEEADTILLTSTTAGALGLLVQLLPEAGIDPAKVQYAGLARWDVPAQTLALSGVQGGLFALPDYARAQSFSTRYEATFSSKPHQLAGLAYDGVAAIGALVARGTNNALGAAALTQTAGFEGVDGIFRLRKDGTNERGLAIATIQDKQVVILDPAPAAFEFFSF